VLPRRGWAEERSSASGSVEQPQSMPAAARSDSRETRATIRMRSQYRPCSSARVAVTGVQIVENRRPSGADWNLRRWSQGRDSNLRYTVLQTEPLRTSPFASVRPGLKCGTRIPHRSGLVRTHSSGLLSRLLSGEHADGFRRPSFSFCRPYPPAAAGRPSSLPTSCGGGTGVVSARRASPVSCRYATMTACNGIAAAARARAWDTHF